MKTPATAIDHYGNKIAITLHAAGRTTTLAVRNAPGQYGYVFDGDGRQVSAGNGCALMASPETLERLVRRVHAVGAAD